MCAETVRKAIKYENQLENPWSFLPWQTAQVYHHSSKQGKCFPCITQENLNAVLSV